MTNLSRRDVLKTVASGVAMASIPSTTWAQQNTPIPRKGNIKQSVSRWCYQSIPLDKLCEYSAQIGCKAIDLLKQEEWEVPRRYGLICAMGYGGGGELTDAMNRVENHPKIEEGLRKSIPIAAKMGVPNVITFSGNRRGMSDAEGAKNTIAGLNRVKKIGEDNGVNICIELLNSKIDHHDYMCDHSAWGIELCKRIASPNFKLLYDIYHMQIMEGDVIATINASHEYFAHYHTGGVPGRHEIDDTQELHYPAIMRAIVDTGFKGHVAQEFIPARPDALGSLRQAVGICDV